MTTSKLTFQPSTTTTSTITVSSTAVPACTNANPTFALSISGGSSPYTNDYLALFHGNAGPNLPDEAAYANSSLTLASAAPFYLANGNIFDYADNDIGTLETGNEGNGYQFFVFFPQGSQVGPGLPCSISNTGQLLCSGGGENNFYLCVTTHPFIFFGNRPPPVGTCYGVVTLQTVPLCYH